MKRIPLRIIDDRYGHRIVWYSEEDGEEGSQLGDARDVTQAKVDAAVGDDKEYFLSHLVASKTKGLSLYGGSFCWESHADAKAALAMVKTAIANIEHPWPEWALTAKANGWKAPKGWKP